MGLHLYYEVSKLTKTGQEADSKNRSAKQKLELQYLMLPHSGLPILENALPTASVLNSSH